MYSSALRSRIGEEESDEEDESANRRIGEEDSGFVPVISANRRRRRSRCDDEEDESAKRKKKKSKTAVAELFFSFFFGRIGEEEEEAWKRKKRRGPFYDVDDVELKEKFSKFGKVTSAKIMRDETGASKGFAFVCLSNPEEAYKAVSYFNGFILHGKPLYAAIAQKKEERKAFLQL
ncbi:hypothetical protein Syun_015494 [Stephania yunnanensis]|uniref:RRM domain-containing protein n=1 Tax=Stephania yunnanensis TaxID=152371 RepID=A0AAP0PAL2_9MAGN